MRQAGVLGEDDRLVSVLRDLLAWLGVSRVDHALGVLVVATGSSDAAANARTAAVAAKLAAETRWAGATTAFATRLEPSLAEAASQLRRRGAPPAGHRAEVPRARTTHRPGVGSARDAGIPIAPPLGAHRLVAATVLERFDQAVANRMVA